MRVGSFEVMVCTGPDNGERKLKEESINNRSYVHAEPGYEYTCKVNIYRDRDDKFPCQYIRIGLYVDGIDVNYWKRIDLSDNSILPKDPSRPVETFFRGFKKNTDELVTFVFASPISSASDTAAGCEQPLGSIKVVIFEAMVVEGQKFHNKVAVETGPQQESSIFEGKKFYEQASLTTKEGKKVDKAIEEFAPLNRWVNKYHTAMQCLTLYYHTPSTIRILAGLANAKQDAYLVDTVYGRKRKVDDVIDLISSGDEAGDDGLGTYSTEEEEEEEEGRRDTTEEGNGGRSSSGNSRSMPSLMQLPSSSSSSSSGSSSGSSSSSSSSSSSPILGRSYNSSSSLMDQAHPALSHAQILAGEISIDNEVTVLVVNKEIPCLEINDDDDDDKPHRWTTIVKSTV